MVKATIHLLSHDLLQWVVTTTMTHVMGASHDYMNCSWGDQNLAKTTMVLLHPSSEVTKGVCRNLLWSKMKSLTRHSWQSWTTSFYLPHGYKVCLAVHLNGIGAGKGMSISIYLHQVAGEYDHKLKWPFLFTEDLEVKLMCQEGTSEIGKHHTTKPSSPSAHR